MSRFGFGSHLLFACLLGFPFSVSAQEFDAPAHLSAVDGTALVARDTDLESATAGSPIVAGDRVQTTAGRVEILFADGTALDVDEYSAVELASPTLIRVTLGRIALTVPGASDPAGAARYQIDTPFASVETESPGEFRISLLPDPLDSSRGRTELAVGRGFATLVSDQGSMPLRAGQWSEASSDQAPEAAQSFNSARADAFERWADSQRDTRVSVGTSTNYLPSNLRMYGAELDRDGTWEYDQSNGYVWYPASVGDWQPYSDGYWTSLSSYGWTWVGLEPWAWPTHHYGRWGYVRGRWFWRPDRRFSPAWVSWASAPGYVSWCPIGFDNRPVVSFAETVGARSPWVVLPQHYFGVHDAHVTRNALDVRQLPPSTPFVAQSSSPSLPRRAVPRGTLGPAGRAPASTYPAVGAPINQQPSAPVPVVGEPRRGNPAFWRGRAVPAAPAVVPPAPPPQSPPGSVPRWSAPSIGVPTWSAPSIGVPQWSAPSIPAPAQMPQTPAPVAVPRDGRQHHDGNPPPHVVPPAAPAPPPAASDTAASPPQNQGEESHGRGPGARQPR
jgi:hypothetical protein